MTKGEFKFKKWLVLMKLVTNHTKDPEIIARIEKSNYVGFIYEATYFTDLSK